MENMNNKYSDEVILNEGDSYIRGVDCLGRVVLPQKYREALGIEDLVEVSLSNGFIIIKKAKTEQTDF